MGKLVMHKSGSKHAFAFTAGNEKSESGRKGVADRPIVAKIHSDGRSVLYGREFGGQFPAGDPQELSGNLRWRGHNYGIEVIRIVRSHGPAFPARLNSMH